MAQASFAQFGIGSAEASVIEIDVDLPARMDLSIVLPLIKEVLRDSQFVVSLCGTLQSYPNCGHWHLTKAGSKGTLELTWWATQPRLWFKVASNRSAVWIEEALPELKIKLESALSNA